MGPRDTWRAPLGLGLGSIVPACRAVVGRAHVAVWWAIRAHAGVGQGPSFNELYDDLIKITKWVGFRNNIVDLFRLSLIFS